MDLKHTITQFILNIANNTANTNTDNTDNTNTDNTNTDNTNTDNTNNSLFNNVILNDKYYYNNINNVNNTYKTNDAINENDENNLLYSYPLYDITDIRDIRDIPDIRDIRDIPDITDITDETLDDSTDKYDIYKIISEKNDTLGQNITNNYIYYNENDDINNELQLYNYHTYKNVGNWNNAKILLIQSNNDKKLTHYLYDYLDIQFKNNNDCFDNISKVYYINNVDIDIIYEFNNTVAKHFVDNIKIQPYIPDGYIFSNSIDTNKWKFTITIITSKNIYTANRYITNTHIGFF